MAECKSSLSRACFFDALISSYQGGESELIRRAAASCRGKWGECGGRDRGSLLLITGQIVVLLGCVLQGHPPCESGNVHMGTVGEIYRFSDQLWELTFCMVLKKAVKSWIHTQTRPELYWISKKFDRSQLDLAVFIGNL